jgi:hypothetical protein
MYGLKTICAPIVGDFDWLPSEWDDDEPDVLFLIGACRRETPVQARVKQNYRTMQEIASLRRKNYNWRTSLFNRLAKRYG